MRRSNKSSESERLLQQLLVLSAFDCFANENVEWFTQVLRGIEHIGYPFLLSSLPHSSRFSRSFFFLSKNTTFQLNSAHVICLYTPQKYRNTNANEWSIEYQRTFQIEIDE